MFVRTFGDQTLSLRSIRSMYRFAGLDGAQIADKVGRFTLCAPSLLASTRRTKLNRPASPKIGEQFPLSASLGAMGRGSGEVINPFSPTAPFLPQRKNPVLPRTQRRRHDLSWNWRRDSIFVIAQSENHFLACQEHHRYEGNPLRFRLFGRGISFLPADDHRAVDQASLPLADHGDQPGVGCPRHPLDSLPGLGRLARRNQA